MPKVKNTNTPDYVLESPIGTNTIVAGHSKFLGDNDRCILWKELRCPQERNFYERESIIL
jgi:hypothetical protein